MMNAVGIDISQDKGKGHERYCTLLRRRSPRPPYEINHTAAELRKPAHSLQRINSETPRNVGNKMLIQLTVKQINAVSHTVER